MGTLVDPTKREKYTLFELLKLIRQYEKIQNNINLLLSDARLSNFQSMDNFQSEDLDIYQLNKQKNKLFSLRKLRCTIISGVHCQYSSNSGYQIGRRFTKDINIEVIEEQSDEDNQESICNNLSL